MKKHIKTQSSVEVNLLLTVPLVEDWDVKYQEYLDALMGFTAADISWWVDRDAVLRNDPCHGYHYYIDGRPVDLLLLVDGIHWTDMGPLFEKIESTGYLLGVTRILAVNSKELEDQYKYVEYDVIDFMTPGDAVEESENIVDALFSTSAFGDDRTID